MCEMNRKQNILIWILSFVMLFSIIKNNLLLSFYLFENETFTELFCVNKDIPELKCNGQCELSKITGQEKNKSEPVSLLDILKNEIAINFSVEIKIQNQLNEIQLSTNFVYINNYSFDFLCDISRPPTLI